MACTCKPGRGLCQSCLQTVFERNKVQPGPAVGPNGEYTLNQVEIFEKNFRDNIVEDVQNNPLTATLAKYPNFFETVENINNDFLQRQYIKDLLPDYPVLEKRLSRGALTPLEFADFIRESNYTPATAIESSNAKGPRFLDELNSYYNGDFSDSIMGGFCGLFSSIFAAVDAFFDIMDSIAGAIADVFSFLRKIKNIADDALAFFESLKVKAIIESIKTKIGDMIKATIKKVCQSIANFNVEAITGPMPIKAPAQIKVVEQIEDKKTNLQQICGDENAERISQKIQNIIDYAVGLFENPSLEEIMALIARICAMAAGIEGLFKQLKDPLNDFSERYDEVFNTLSNASNRVTGEAIRAGAIRYSPVHREKEINKATAIWTDAGNPPPPEVKEIKDVPSWEEIKDNKHDKIRIKGGWTLRMKPTHEGWTRLDPEVRVMLMRLHAAAVKEGILSRGYIFVNSGWRSQEYNAGIDGAAKKSQHLSGKALDLTWPGFRPRGSDLNRMVQLARHVGFKGIGYYKTFLHVDIGPKRSWDSR